MPDIKHNQFDELPVRDFTLSFPSVAEGSWPALNPTDKVTMLLKQGATDRAIALTIVDAATRKVRWTPAAPVITTAVAAAPFRVRVTQTDGKSYSHPGPDEAAWTLTIVAAPTATDLADPA